jgi:hypothetical protein
MNHRFAPLLIVLGCLIAATPVEAGQGTYTMAQAESGKKF